MDQSTQNTIKLMAAVVVAAAIVAVAVLWVVPAYQHNRLVERGRTTCLQRLNAPLCEVTESCQGGSDLACETLRVALRD